MIAATSSVTAADFPIFSEREWDAFAEPSIKSKKADTGPARPLSFAAWTELVRSQTEMIALVWGDEYRYPLEHALRELTSLHRSAGAIYPLTFVMDAWGKDKNAEQLMMVADGNGEFTKALGLEMDGSGFGLGTRSQRYAMIVDDGTVSKLSVEDPGKLEVSAAEAILEAL